MRFILACLALLSVGCSAGPSKQHHFDRGQEYFAAGKFPEAIIEFRNAVSQDEQWGEARFRLAEAYAAHAEPEQAYRHYIRAADLLPEDANAQLKAAAYLLLAGQHEDAKARAEQVLARHPENVDAQVALGSALVGLRNLDGAITQITEAIQLDPSRSQSYMTLARIRVAQGRVDEARAAFDRAVSADSRSVGAHLARANFHWSVGDLAGAEQSLKHVLEVEPGNILTRRVLATLYLGSGRPAEAETHLNYVVEATNASAARLSLADYYTNSRRYEDARRVLQPLSANETTRAEAEIRLAQILYSQGQKAAGQRRLEAVLVGEPSNHLAHAMQARWLLSDGKPQEALEHARSALAVSPQMIPALYLKAEAETRTRRTTDAIKSLFDILRVNPHDAEAQAQLSGLYLQRNQTDSAVQLAEEAVSNAPNSIDARLAMVRALLARGSLQAAATDLSVAKARAPTSPAVHVLEGVLRMRTGDHQAAQSSFERAFQLDATSREALTGLTTLDVTQNNVSRARTRLEAHLAERDRDDPELLLLAAKVALADNDVSRAEDLLKQAVLVDPLDVESVALLARLLTQQRKLAASLEAFDAEVARNPDNLSARLMGAVVVHTQGNLADARIRYEAILKREPRAALAANNLASIYADAGTDLLEAQRLAESAAELWPSHAGIQDTLGAVYLRRRLYGPAIERFRKSVAAEPANAAYHYNLGRALAESGAPERAREAFQQAVKLNPGMDSAQRALKEPPLGQPVSGVR